MTTAKKKLISYTYPIFSTQPGPVSRDPAMLERMMETGMNVARMNFSHGSHEYHAETIKNCRIAEKNYSAKLGTPFSLAIALDTKGPEIRTGLLEGVSRLELLNMYCFSGLELSSIMVFSSVLILIHLGTAQYVFVSLFVLSRFRFLLHRFYEEEISRIKDPLSDCGHLIHEGI